ncbi:hypothetical protein BB558_000602 [Smittium angustum]|uniref:BZIP domain-containing protein n=1 Tax=Smittium angustum TaxID=133377 RepID=A0A2U1JDV5_SMIAN|nr:hypothetical protein BB558_000602 [Smittium angustum]
MTNSSSLQSNSSGKIDSKSKKPFLCTNQLDRILKDSENQTNTLGLFYNNPTAGTNMISFINEKPDYPPKEKIVHFGYLNLDNNQNINHFDMKQYQMNLSNLASIENDFEISEKLDWSRYLETTANASPLWSTGSSVSDDISYVPCNLTDASQQSFSHSPNSIVYGSNMIDYSTDNNTNLINTVDLIMPLDATELHQSDSTYSNNDLINKACEFSDNYHQTPFFHTKSDIDNSLDSLINQYINTEALGNSNQLSQQNMEIVKNSLFPSETTLFKTKNFFSPIGLDNSGCIQPALITNNTEKFSKKLQNASNTSRLTPKTSSNKESDLSQLKKALQSKSTNSLSNIAPLIKAEPGTDIISEHANTNAFTNSTTNQQKSISKHQKKPSLVRKNLPKELEATYESSTKKIKVEPTTDCKHQSRDSSPKSNSVQDTLNLNLNLNQTSGSASKFTNILPRADLNQEPPKPAKQEQVTSKFSLIRPLNYETNSKTTDNSVLSEPLKYSLSNSGPTSNIQVKPMIGSKQQATPDQVAAKRQERLIKNRAAALQSRKKRREHMDFLEQKVNDLEDENTDLKKKVQETEALLKLVQEQLSALRIETESSKANSTTNDNSSNKLELSKVKTNVNKSINIISIQPDGHFENQHPKQTFVGSVLMAVLFSFTIFCFPSPLDSQTPKFTHSGIDSTHHIPESSEIISCLGNNSFDKKLSSAQLISKHNSDEKHSSQKHIISHVRKSIREFTRHIVPSSPSPLVLPNELPFTYATEPEIETLRKIDFLNKQKVSLKRPLTTNESNHLHEWISNNLKPLYVTDSNQSSISEISFNSPPNNCQEVDSSSKNDANMKDSLQSKDEMVYFNDFEYKLKNSAQKPANSYNSGLKVDTNGFMDEKNFA